MPPETRQHPKLHPLEHRVERTQPQGKRSGPGDLDLVSYSLRKYFAARAQGPPDRAAAPVRADRADAGRDGAPASWLSECSFEEVITEIDEVDRLLETALEQTTLPAEPDRAAVVGFLVETYRRARGWR